MLRGRNVGSHEGASMLERGTINSGLPHYYLHENLISLFSAAKESSFVPYLSPVVVFLLTIPTSPEDIHYGSCENAWFE